MIIRRMTATFGNLDHATLTPAPGLNILEAPNESGKSTWSAFLLSMFYGLGTERRRQGALVAKDRYKPWSGKAMEGVVELTWQGKNITLERSSTARTPMGNFKAYDTDTGEALDWLTAENCGRTLLGVEQSVFVRSAFIGQNAMGVSQDAELEQKLSSLVTTGDESVSYTRTEKLLREWQNHVRHNKTGFLPETERKLDNVRHALSGIHEYHRQDLSLLARQQELTAREQELQAIAQNLKQVEAAKNHARLKEAGEAFLRAQSTLDAARQTTSALPPSEDLQRLLLDAETIIRQESLLDGASLPEAPKKPEGFAVFRDMSPVEAMDFASRTVQKLTPPTPVRGAAWLYLPALLFLAGGLSLGFILSPLFLLLLVPGLACVAAELSLRARQKALYMGQQAENQKILNNFGAETADDILSQAYRYGQARQEYEMALAEFETRQKNHAAQGSQISRQKEAFLQAVRAFAPSIYTLEDAVAAVQAAQTRQEQLFRAEKSFHAAESAYLAVKAAVGDVPATQMPPEDLSLHFSAGQVARELEQIRQELLSLGTTLAQHQGNVQSLGDPAGLEAQKFSLEEQKQRLERREKALILARETLESSHKELQSRFSPQISQLAGQLFSRMTGGKYHSVRLVQDMRMEVRPTGEALTRPQEGLSGGTLDELYLSLRLAICKLLLGDQVPILLDDALVFFDDVRMGKILDLLKEEAETRQILLFTCQGREKAYLNA